MFSEARRTESRDVGPVQHLVRSPPQIPVWAVVDGSSIGSVREWLRDLPMSSC
jgi:hypothetical protein